MHSFIHLFTFPRLGGIERQSVRRDSHHGPVFVVKLLAINVRVTGQHGPAIREVEGSSPSRAYYLVISEDWGGGGAFFFLSPLI